MRDINEIVAGDRANTKRLRAEQEARQMAEKWVWREGAHVNPGKDEDGLYPSERPRATDAPGYAEFAAKLRKARSEQDAALDIVRAGAAPPTPLPTDAEARKGIPVATGVLDYFPAALAEVAKVSKAGNDQHNPGEPLHWARGKSMDQADTCVRHLMERGGVDVDGMRHSAKAAWRALALLQIELEEAGEAPRARGASV